MKRFWYAPVGLLIALATVLTFSVQQEAQSAKEGELEDPKVAAVLFYADWCGKCKELDPKIEEVKTNLKGQGVLFTKFDLTDEFTTEQSSLLAAWTGLDEVFMENQKTGFMLLVDTKTGKPISTIKHDASKREIGLALNKAAGSAGKRMTAPKSTP